MDVLSILRSKNRCLEKLLIFSREFLATAALSGAEILESIEKFQLRRDAAIKALELYDRKISEMVPQIKSDPVLVEAVRKELSSKVLVVQQLIDLDQQIIQAIEAEKSRIQREISNQHKSAETLRKFKSNWVPESGEGLDTKL